MRIVTAGDSVGVLLAQVLDAEDRAVWGAYIESIGEAHLPDADLVIVSLGVNDARRPGPLPVDALVDGLLRIPHAVYVAPAVAPWRSRQTARRCSVLAEAVRAAGVTTVERVVPAWGWQRDGIHPNHAGLERIARRCTALS